MFWSSQPIKGIAKELVKGDDLFFNSFAWVYLNFLHFKFLWGVFGYYFKTTSQP